MFQLTFGKLSVSRKPIINGGAIRPTGLLFSYKSPATTDQKSILQIRLFKYCMISSNVNYAPCVLCSTRALYKAMNKWTTAMIMVTQPLLAKNDLPPMVITDGPIFYSHNAKQKFTLFYYLKKMFCHKALFCIVTVKSHLEFF